MGRILAIDYGKRRVGLAVTDTLQISANGLETVDEKQALTFIQRYVEANAVEKILIGYATHADGTDTDSTAAVRKFITQLHKLCPRIPLIKRDEANTSKRAVQAMIAGGFKKMQRRKKENIDKMSAVLILQEYLQNQ